MRGLEARLDPRRFVRIHRSCLVNIDRVREMHPLFHGDWLVVLAGGARLTMSRTYRERVQRLLGAAR
jgi:two-component system LytT family response regulator